MVQLNMTPMTTFNDVLDSPWTNPDLFCNVANPEPISVISADFQHRCFGEYCSTIFYSWTGYVATFGEHVKNVILLSPKEQMDGPKARWVIAAMTDIQAFWNRSTGKFKGNPMYQEPIATSIQNPIVASSDFTSIPFDTRVVAPRPRKIILDGRQEVFQMFKTGSLKTHGVALLWRALLGPESFRHDTGLFHFNPDGLSPTTT